MPFFDFSLDQLKTYVPAREEAADFDAFWASTLSETRQHPLAARFEPVDFGLKTVDVFDVTYNGYGGQPIKGWLLLPRNLPRPLPCVVEYIGYGGGRGFPYSWLLWSAAGYAHFVMDTRGQGYSSGNHGSTPDPELDGGNSQVPGFMTRGILDPKTYFYRRVFTDAVRAVEAARAHTDIDPARVAVTGGSQGGGITLPVAGLQPDVAAAMPNVPFLCHYRRAVTLIDTAPYNEISRYCQAHRDKIDTVFNTLSYFDGVNLAARAKAPTLFSVALMDNVCPPSTVYAAYNHYAGPKDIRVYEFNNHEGGQMFQTHDQVTFLQNVLK